MARKVHSALITLLALAIVSCGPSKPIHYYTIHTAMAPAVAQNSMPISLLVGSITGPHIMQDTPIAYQVGANEIGTYQYSRWVEPPVEMLKAKLMRALGASGNYRSVAALGSTSDGQFVLRGTLYEFQEVDGDGISAAVSMGFELYDRKSGKVVWSHSYAQSEPVVEKKIPAIVAALEKNLDRGLKEVTTELGQHFALDVAAKR